MKKLSNWFNNKWGWFFTNGYKQSHKQDEYLVDMDTIHIALYNAKRFNLEIEVVYEALKYSKQNPNSSISEAITEGYKNWIK